MTRIRTFHVLFCLLLLACFLPTVACQNRDVGRRRGRERGVNRSSLRRLQGNDKNATPSPNIAPSLVPTAAPTVASALPTASPTDSPTDASALPTASPTDSPTYSPTVEVTEEAVGSLAMRLYVVDDTTSASDVNEGRSSDWVQGITAGLLEVQCQVGLVVVFENDVDGTNACDSGRRLQREGDSVVFTAAQVAVTDEKTENGEKYMDCKFVFPVLQIGADYVNTGGDDAMAAMQAETETALADYIRGGFMDAKLPDTATAYAADQDIEKSDDGGDSVDAHPFHTLRMAGVVLFVVTVVLTFLLFKISSRRKLERETDDALAKLKLGGLVTEEGLDLMLETGRQESLEVGLRGQNSSREEMLASSRRNAQARGNDDDEDDDEGVSFRYLPSVLSPVTSDSTSQTKTKDKKGGQEDAGLDLGDSSLNVAEAFEGLGEGLEESVAGFFARLFPENPNSAESKK